MKFSFFLVFSLFFLANVQAQYLMDGLDTSSLTGKGMLTLYKNFNGLKLSGYIQPQFQIAETKGINSFEGGDFGPGINNRFMLRRSRVKIDYMHFGQQSHPDVQFVFQIDANERAVTVRDVWGRISENKLKLFSFTTGIFARPFGFEVNYSSGNRESPERGRMSQLHMKSERDLGAMLSYQNKNEEAKAKWLKIDAGIFNGQGITANGEFDNVKDFIGRVSLLPVVLHNKIQISGSTSYLKGGITNNNKYYYSTKNLGGNFQTLVDSSLSNIGKTSNREYAGADVQVKIKNKIGYTELRGEFIQGQQTGTRFDATTPTKTTAVNEAFYLRNFSGGYLYFLQNLFSVKHQLVVKYDWYDPNTKVKKEEISSANNFTNADVAYATLGLGYIYYLDDNAKLMIYYAIPQNEKTLLSGFTKDVKDNVFTLRLQFMF